MGTPIQSRADFKALSKARLDEARLLLAARKWDGAYYLTGYAVELGLKACIMKMLKKRDAFPDRKFSDNCYVHDPEKLVETAGLKSALSADIVTDAILLANWGFVKKWNETSRYSRWTEAEARAMLDAVTDADHGVISWIKKHW